MNQSVSRPFGMSMYYATVTWFTLMGAYIGGDKMNHPIGILKGGLLGGWVGLTSVIWVPMRSIIWLSECL